MDKVQIIRAIIACLLAAIASGQIVSSGEKWSRQLESSGPGDADTFDWVPVAQPVDGSKDRSQNGRVLTYSQTFPPNAKIGDIPKHHHHQQQQQNFGFPYQFQRFPTQHNDQHHQAPQAGPLHHSKSNGLQQPQQPTSQSFFKFEMPSYHSDGSRQEGSPPVQTGYQIHHTFGGNGAQATLYSSPLFNQKPVFPPEFHPASAVSHRPHSQPVRQKPIQQNFIEDIPSIAKNQFRESKPFASQDNLGTVAPQTFPVQPEPDVIPPSFELQKPSSFQSQLPYQAPPTDLQEQDPNTQDQQEVQLLYVPYDTLYNPEHHHPQPHQPTNQEFEINRYNVQPAGPVVNPYHINSFYTPETLVPQDPHLFTTSTTRRPTTSTLSTTSTTLKPSSLYQNFLGPQYSTVKPKPKAHQPPLAMFLYRNTARPTQSDVVSALRNSHNVAVLDAPTKHTPNIFIGPAGMPIPNGFVKFDLPYLSQIDQNRNLRDVPFFVAPLSYRTPNGFNKILLPEPHVGSIVVNKLPDNYETVQQPQKQKPIVQQVNPNSVYITPSQNSVNQYSSTTLRNRPSVGNQESSSTSQDYYPDLIRQVLATHQDKFTERGRNHYETTSQRAQATPSRGYKWHELTKSQNNYYQDPIPEVQSPKVTKLKQRPYTQSQSIDHGYTQTQRPYAQFKPMPNNIVNEEYFKVQPIKTSSVPASTSTPSSTSTSTPAPAYHTPSYPTNPQIEFQSTSGQLYPEVSTPGPAPSKLPTNPRFTSRPSSSLQQQQLSSANDEEYRMKQYFRQQEAFRKRPQISLTTSTTSAPFESVRYTPVSLEYDREVRIPSSTSSQHTTSTPRTTSSKQRFTFYSPAPTTTANPEDNFNTVPPKDLQQQVVEFSRDSDSQTPTEVIIGQAPEKIHPSNHRPTYNSNTNNNNELEFEPNPYQLPSELPPLTPNLPGLVNSLQEKDKQNAIEKHDGSTPLATSSPDYDPNARPTRRPINRVRKPLVVSKVSSSVSYSSTETSTRRPINRIRRPYAPRNYTTSTTTPRPSTSRNPIIRNPNRIRYNPTPEERQSLRIKSRKHYNGSKKAAQTEDLDYQRDVLKQNYPVIKSSTRINGDSTASSGNSFSTVTTDRPYSESQQIYTVTPSSSGDHNFPGLLEPMQIAQQYQEYSKDNYGPGYFPNEEDMNPTESIIRNEINPVYTTALTSTISTSTTTTTEEPPATTRRSPFIRRGPRIRTTTTEAPTTIASANEDRYTIRPRLPPRKVIKVRTRTRKPHPASTTNAPEEETETESEISHQSLKGNNYRKLNRFNQEFYQDESPRRTRLKSQFQLDGQESQWSPSLSSKSSNNNFKAWSPKERRVMAELKFAKEPEIVTANPDEADSNKESDTYEFNLSAGFGPTANTYSKSNSSNEKLNTKTEKSFAELIEEVMGDTDNKKESEETNPKTTDGTFFESQKTDRLIKRGKWKKVRVHPVESFETAESQNIGAQFFNSLYTGSTEKSTESIHESTPETILKLTTQPIDCDDDITTTEPSDLLNIDITTKTMETTTTQTPLDDFPFEERQGKQSEKEESATRRIDKDDLSNVEDLESQPSLFSEVRKQLSDLFAIEEDDETLTAATANISGMPKARYDYTNIQRVRTETPTAMPTAATTTTNIAPTKEEGKTKRFHKDLMDSVVYATSTSTKVTSETEICYRGRCIKSDDLPPNHKLH